MSTAHTHARNNPPPPPLPSIAPPQSDSQSESDVIAKVAGGCYIPEAVVCGVQRPTLSAQAKPGLAAPAVPPGHRLNPALCGAWTHQGRASRDRADASFPSDGQYI